MAKNTGKPSEMAFERRIRALGKSAWFFRFMDAAEVVGRTGKGGFIRPQPSDYMLVIRGITIFAEVKSTTSATSFAFSLLRPTQSAMAEMIEVAGGIYKIFVHRLDTDQWYNIPYSLVRSTKAAGRSSLPWAQLEEYLW